MSERMVDYMVMLNTMLTVFSTTYKVRRGKKLISLELNMKSNYTLSCVYYNYYFIYFCVCVCFCEVNQVVWFGLIG